MGNVNMEAYQVHYSGDKSVADKLKELDAIAQQIEDLPTFTSDDRVFLEAVPAMPAAEGKTVLTAITDDQGETELTYETPEVESEDIAPEFSEEVAYGEGDLVYYEGILYKFTADHAAGAWDPSEVTQTTVAAEFNALKNTLNDDTTHYIGNTLLTTINTYNASWEATSNGWCVGYIYSTNDHLAIVSIDGDTIVSSGGVSNAANMVFPVCFPIKKGQTLMTRNDSATFYNIKVLSMG